MDAINEVSVEISVVLGKAVMPVHQLLKMGRGAIIELEGSVDAPVWVFANNHLIARGDVVISGENVAVAISHVMET